MRGILINPNTKTITEIELSEVIDTLTAMRRSLTIADPAFSGTVELLRLTPRADLWFDEEGNMSAGRAVFNFNGAPIVGAALVLGHADGETVGLNKNITIQGIEVLTAWTDLVTTGEFTQGRTEDTPHGFMIHAGKPVHIRREQPAAE